VDEVSGRFAKWVYDSGLRDGVDQPALLAGVAVGADVLSKGKDRINWDDYVQMLENYHDAVGLEGMKDSAHSFGTSKEIRSFGRMAGLFFSPQRLYQFMYRWVGNHFLRNVQFKLSPHKDGSLKLVSTIDEGTRGSKVYFMTLTNVLAGTPKRIGRDLSKVEITSLDDHRAEYHIVPPVRSSGIIWMLGWPLRALASIGSIREVFIRQQEEIREGQTAIDRQREEFAAMVERLADPLFIIGKGGETLFVNRTARLWFMVPDPPRGWRPASALEGEVEGSRWDALVAGEVEEQELAFVRQDLGNTTVKLAFQSAEKVEFNSQEAALLIGRDVTEKRKVEAQILDASFKERESLGKEIHDDLGQLLTAVSLKADALANQLDRDESGNGGAAEEIAGISREAIAKARNLVHRIVASDERPENLRRGLMGHAKKVRKDFGLEVELDLPDTPLTLLGQRALEVLRIVQEATHNAAKHSGCSKIRITMKTGEEFWTIRIIDDGAGLPGTDDPVFRTKDFKGVGIGSMGDRAAQLGGTLEVGNRKDGQAGVEVVLTFPWKGENLPVSGATVLTETDEAGLRLLIADDHAMVRDAMVARMKQEADFVVCGQLSIKAEILPAVANLSPDVLITDMMMDDGDNLDVIQKLREEFPSLAIVVISMFDEEYYGAAALGAGADVYMNKNSDSRELVAAIRSAHRKRNGG